MVTNSLYPTIIRLIPSNVKIDICYTDRYITADVENT